MAPLFPNVAIRGPAVDFPHVSRETLSAIPRQSTTLGKNYSVGARKLDTNYPEFPVAKKITNNPTWNYPREIRRILHCLLVMA